MQDDLINVIDRSSCNNIKKAAQVLIKAPTGCIFYIEDDNTIFIAENNKLYPAKLITQISSKQIFSITLEPLSLEEAADNKGMNDFIIFNLDKMAEKKYPTKHSIKFSKMNMETFTSYLLKHTPMGRTMNSVIKLYNQHKKETG